MKGMRATLAGMLIAQVPVVALAAGQPSSPISWSPDSQWLAYTIVIESRRETVRPRWLFETEHPQQPSVVKRASGALRKARSAPVIYQIWTTERGNQGSVLIEESRHPLSSPAWSPEGRAIAYGRFVGDSMDLSTAPERGRFEFVVQEGLDRKRVVWTSPEIELDAHAGKRFPHSTCSWSQDGRFLAIPRPGLQPALVIVRVGVKTPLTILERALVPSWSPDGTKLAFLRPENGKFSLHVVDRHGERFGTPQPVISTIPFAAKVFWTSDSRSVFALVEKSLARLRDLEIERIFLDGAESIRVLTLLSEQLRPRRRSLVQGVTVDCDREGERCGFAVEQEGQEAAVAWGLLRDRETRRTFHPLDVSQRIGALALAPDGTTLALRFGQEDDLTPPALCDLASERLTLLAPDESARQSWFSLLVGLARSLLAEGLPPARFGSQPARRPTLLPIVGELSDRPVLPTPPQPAPPLPFPHLGLGDRQLLREIQSHQPLDARLRQIARLGLALLNHADQASAPSGAASGTSVLEARLFFSYLTGDYPRAEASLAPLEATLESPELRLAALALRAQIVWAAGERERAGPIITYLLSVLGSETMQLESTPLGPVLTKEVSPSQAWGRYLWLHTLFRAPARVTAESNGESEPAAGFGADDVPPAPREPAPDGGLVPFNPALPVR
jgi:Tol biopolymer transport system component